MPPEGTIDNPPAAGNDAFPVTVTTTYGETTLYEKPERIVALGMSNLDILTSLGVTPVAFADDGYTVNGGSPDFSNAPWVDSKVSADLWDVGLADGEVNAEAIAAYDPDLLIVGTRDAEDGNMYETLFRNRAGYTSVPRHPNGRRTQPRSVSSRENPPKPKSRSQLSRKRTKMRRAACQAFREDVQHRRPGRWRDLDRGAVDAPLRSRTCPRRQSAGGRHPKHVHGEC